MEYPQHMFWLRNKKNNFQLRTLNWRPGISHMHVQLYSRAKVLNFGLSLHLLPFMCVGSKSTADIYYKFHTLISWFEAKH